MRDKIIIGYEPTPQGEDALALGAIFAEVLGAKTIVATDLSWPQSLMGPSDLERALEVDTDELFAVARDRLLPLEVETRAIANPSPAAGLYQLAELEYASLLVLGSSHRGPVGRVFPGSVAESLLHGAPCAIAVAPRGFGLGPERRLLRIAVAFDGSAEAWAALETAIGIARRTHASLGILTVAERPHIGESTSMVVLNLAELHDLERREKQRILELALHRVPHGLDADGHVLTGEPGPTLAEAAGDFDLIITGSRGYGPLRRTILGSASAELIRHAPCPVLVLPRGVGVDPLGVGRTAAAEAVG